ncbi:MAG TPA: hypothetical protein VH044_04215 [Polyangiaceae bacterium]|nr:hypothetical protein [Polyangiaceae bacterium]
MDPKERARKLVALATDAGASSEEARTAAMAACRLIAKHELLDAPADRVNGAARRRPGSGRPASHDGGHGRRQTQADPRAGDHADGETNYRAARTGTCAFCANPFGPDDEVMAYARGSVDHWHCAKRRAAGAEPGS